MDAEGALRGKLIVETVEFGLGSLSLRDYDATSGGILFVLGRSNSDSDEPVRGPICFAALRVSSELLLVLLL